MNLKTDALVLGGVAGYHLSGVVRGTVVTDQQFKILKILFEHGFNRLRQITRIIICRNKDADFRGCHMPCFIGQMRRQDLNCIS